MYLRKWFLYWSGPVLFAMAPLWQLAKHPSKFELKPHRQPNLCAHCEVISTYFIDLQHFATTIRKCSKLLSWSHYSIFKLTSLWRTPQDCPTRQLCQRSLSRPEQDKIAMRLAAQTVLGSKQMKNVQWVRWHDDITISLNFGRIPCKSFQDLFGTTDDLGISRCEGVASKIPEQLLGEVRIFQILNK